MPSDQTRRQSAVIWQGFHHAWEYNHRLNRLGSYVGTRSGSHQPHTIVGHTAASGTGGDMAQFSEFVTGVEADGVAFQAGQAETRVECPRAVTAPFHIKIDELALETQMKGKQTVTVLINGFDLYAERHADKLIAFDLEITDPIIYEGGTKVRFNILGHLCFDCRTAECQLWPFSLEMEQVDSRQRPPEDGSPSATRRGIRNRPAFEQGMNWIKSQIARITDLENVKQGIVGRDEDRLRRRLFRLFGREFFLRLIKMRGLTPYVLRVHYLIIGGDKGALQVTDCGLVQNRYAWDAETEIQFEEKGTQSIAVAGDDPDGYALNAFGFKHLSLTTELDQDFGSSNPIQWGKGMHLLEWDAAVRDIASAGDRVTATLDLFYKSWSEAMNEVITLTTWGSVRSAGRATLGARLLLLQFKEAARGAQQVLPGRIRWPGGGLNAREDPRACFERSLNSEKGKGL